MTAKMSDSSVVPLDEAALRKAAADVAAQAYAPYSRFYVGAAILLSNGETVTGCNVENASYRLTCCAEQTAIARAVAQFGPGVRLLAVAVANLDPTIACAPCGGCRQTIAEFADSDCPIFFPSGTEQGSVCTLADLLPARFNAAVLPARGEQTV